MKRRLEDGAGGGTAKKLPSGARFAMKLLFSPEEVGAINGPDECGFGEIQQITGAHLVTNGGFYPGTELLEIAFTGPSEEEVSAALVESMTNILRSELGAMTNGEQVMSSDDARLKAVLPTKAAAAVIGRGGETIKELRAETGCKFHVDTNSIPPGGGEEAEQIVALSGTLDGIQLAVPKIVQFVGDFTEEPWFAAWAASSNAGLHIPGLRVEFTGKGAHTKGKGKAGSFDNVAPAIGSVSGEVCQFFAKAGWCKYGDACKHSHSIADIALVEALNAEGPVAPPPPSGEPCLFYQKTGWCKYGDACRHSHAGAPPASSVVCRFFAREGWCKFGDACRNSHQLASSSTAPAAAPQARYAEVVPSVSGEICQFFAKAGWCKYGDACKHAHVSSDPVFAAAPAPAPVSAAPPNSSGEMCQFFVKAGWCKYGDACRHSHGVEVAPVGPPTHYGPHGPGQLPPAIAPAIGPAITPVVAAPALPPSGEVCQFFSKAGWCKYGDACRYAHIDPKEQANPHASALVSTAMNLLRQPPNTIAATAAPAQRVPQSGEICQFFVKAGWCKYGDACKHSHIVEQPMEMMAPPASQGVTGEICQFFAKAGWCKYGEACKHSHDTGMSFEPAAPVSTRPSSGEVCQFFAKAGWCKFGDACKHIHERIEEVAPGRPPGGLSLPPASSGEVCQFFARAGWCKYGDACKHVHERPPNGEGPHHDLGAP